MVSPPHAAQTALAVYAPGACVSFVVSVATPNVFVAGSGELASVPTEK
jgi:hypothetical protein